MRNACGVNVAGVIDRKKTPLAVLCADDSCRAIVSHGERGDAHGIVLCRRKQRLHSQTVAHQQQPASGFVPYRESKDPVQVMNAVLAPLHVRVEQDLRIGAGLELVAQANQFARQLRLPTVIAVAPLWTDQDHRTTLLGHDSVVGGPIVV